MMDRRFAAAEMDGLYTSREEPVDALFQRFKGRVNTAIRRRQAESATGIAKPRHTKTNLRWKVVCSPVHDVSVFTLGMFCCNQTSTLRFPCFNNAEFQSLACSGGLKT